MAYDVFVSYSTKDKSTADAICAALEANGIRCWIAPRDILPGSDWGEAIIDAIHACRAMVLVFSGSSNASSQIKREIERAVNVGIPVVPFRIEDVLPSKTLEYFISTQHWLDALTPPLEQHLQYLVNTMRAILVQKVDGSEAEVREPQLKPKPAVPTATPPTAAAAESPVTPPPAAPAAPAPPPATAVAPAPAAGDSGRKFASPLLIGMLILAVAVVVLAGVLWKRGGPPATPPVAVKPPEKPVVTDKAPQPAQPAQPALPAPDPRSRFQVGRQWAIDWQSVAKYWGVMQIQQQLGANRYLTRITVSFLSNKNKEITVSMDGLLTIRGTDVVINCSNASESWWDTDDFYLELNNDTMTGYNIDKKGRRGKAVFRFVEDFSPAAPASLSAKPDGRSKAAGKSPPGGSLEPVIPPQKETARNIAGTWEGGLVNGERSIYEVTQARNKITWEGSGKYGVHDWEHTATGTIRGDEITAYFEDTDGSYYKSKGSVKGTISEDGNSIYWSGFNPHELKWKRKK